MTLFFLQLTSSESSFEYTFSQELVIGLKASLKKRDRNFFEINIEHDNVMLDIRKGYSIDFTIENSCSKFFGFENDIVKSGKHKLSNANKICEKKYNNIFICIKILNLYLSIILIIFIKYFRRHIPQKLIVNAFHNHLNIYFLNLDCFTIHMVRMLFSLVHQIHNIYSLPFLRIHLY
uniref:Uncharacterized protein n=1 Tax=Heterorhabditis bacteriophora TaxID=37862 RepID=A0A1I7W6J7_HETBA